MAFPRSLHSDVFPHRTHWGRGPQSDIQPPRRTDSVEIILIIQFIVKSTHKRSLADVVSWH